MTVAERTPYIEQLKSSRDKYCEAVSGLSEAQAKFKPGPDRWSIEEITEHLALAEKGMLTRIKEMSKPAERLHRPEREEEIKGMITNRATPRKAPETVVPTGRFGSLANALAQFRANREETIAYMEQCPEDLRARTVEHPLGLISCQEFSLVLINHPLRHIGQIQEIKASIGYPG